MRGFVRGISAHYEGDQFEPPHASTPLYKDNPKEYEGDEPKNAKTHHAESEMFNRRFIIIRGSS